MEFQIVWEIDCQQKTIHSVSKEISENIGEIIRIDSTG